MLIRSIIIIHPSIHPSGKQLRAYIAKGDHRDRPYNDNEGDHRRGKRHKSGNEGGGGSGEGANGCNAEAAEPKTLNEAVTPLLHLPYEEQIHRKQEDMMNLCITKMFKEVRKTIYQRNHLQKQNQKQSFAMPPWVVAGPQDFPMENIRPSPTTTDYR